MQFLDAFTFIPSTEYHVDVTRLQDKGKAGTRLVWTQVAASSKEGLNGVNR